MTLADLKPAVLQHARGDAVQVANQAQPHHELARRLDGGVSPQTLQEELIAGGYPVDEAAALVAGAQRKSLARTGLQGVWVGGLGICVGLGLVAWNGNPRSAGIPLVVGLTYFLIGLWRLLRSALPQRSQRIHQLMAFPRPGSIDWLSNTLEREAARRCADIKTIRWMTVSVLLAPMALVFWMQLRSLRRRRLAALDILQNRPSDVLWCYVKQRETYGMTLAFLVLGIQTEGGRRQLLELPIPEADADRALDLVRGHTSEAIIGCDPETRRAFRRGLPMKNLG
jgi:hypothetical protein